MKRLLKGGLIFFGVLFLSIAAVLTFYSEIHIQNKIEVSVDADHAFVVMVDESTMKQWFPQIKKLRVVSGLPLQPGSLNELVLDFDGEEILVNATIEEFKAFEKLNLKLENHIFSGFASIYFEQNESGSTVNINADLKGQSILSKIGFIFYQSEIQKMADVVGEKFKYVAEH